LGVACLAMGSVRGPVTLALGFVALRLFGQGSLELVSKTVINHWWVRRRGMAMGIASLTSSVLGTGLWPSLVQGLIALSGWRAAYRWLGLGVVALMVPIGLLIYRHPPEVYGLAPDADLKVLDPQGAPPVAEEHWTAHEAVRTKAFWVAALGLASMSMLTTGLHFHMVGIIADAGLTSAIAAQIFLPMAITGALVVLIGGVLADRIAVRFLLAAALAFHLAPLLSGVWLALLYGLVLGATGGLQSAVSNVIWPNYFGRRHLGSIAGITYLISVAGSSLGPMPMGIARDLLGSFALVLNLLAIIPLALALLSLTMRPPRRALSGVTTTT
jgi:sugar phosphate permease